MKGCNHWNLANDIDIWWWLRIIQLSDDDSSQWHSSVNLGVNWGNDYRLVGLYLNGKRTHNSWCDRYHRVRLVSCNKTKHYKKRRSSCCDTRCTQLTIESTIVVEMTIGTFNRTANRFSECHGCLSILYTTKPSPLITNNVSCESQLAGSECGAHYIVKGRDI